MLQLCQEALGLSLADKGDDLSDGVEMIGQFADFGLKAVEELNRSQESFSDELHDRRACA